MSLTTIPADRPTCAVCRKPLPHEQLARFACRFCEEAIDTQLAELPELYGRLEGALVPGSQVGPRVGGSRTAPLPVALLPLSLRAKGGIVTVLQAWQVDWHDRLGWGHPRWRGDLEEQLGHVVKALRNNLPWACELHPAAAEFATEVRELHSAATRALESHPAANVRVPCTQTVWDEDAGNERRCDAAIRIDMWADHLDCRACGRRYERDEWHLLRLIDPHETRTTP